MIKKLLVSFALVSACAITSNASAAQFGFEGAGIVGRGLNIDHDHDDTQFDTRAGEIGFMFDTGNFNSPFNYRLGVGYISGKGDNFEGDDFDYPNADYNYKGLMVTNSFRLWIGGRGPVRMNVGPSIYLGALRLEDENNSNIDSDAGYFGVGPTFSMDIDMGPATTMTLELGYRYGFTSVEDDDDFSDFETSEFVARMGWLFGN